MPRPLKKRHICREPQNVSFAPEYGKCRSAVVLGVDEYETIRLIDLNGYTQEECSEQMRVSRTTIQGVYNEARKKIADAIVNGKRLLIQGGDYVLCSEYDKCRCDGCCRVAKSKNLSEGSNMIIAATYENGMIFQHFGRTQTFMLYDVKDGKVIAKRELDASGSEHGAKADLLKSQGVEVLICGGFGEGAARALNEAEIKICGGAAGNADEAVEAYLAGTLVYDDKAKCHHHGENEQHGHDRGCGNHNCKR